jgi:hypothetical protein
VLCRVRGVEKRVQWGRVWCCEEVVLSRKLRMIDFGNGHEGMDWNGWWRGCFADKGPSQRTSEQQQQQLHKQK